MWYPSNEVPLGCISNTGRSGVRNGEWISMHLASFTGFTYWIRISLRIKPETRHQVT